MFGWVTPRLQALGHIVLLPNPELSSAEIVQQGVCSHDHKQMRLLVVFLVPLP